MIQNGPMVQLSGVKTFWNSTIHEETQVASAEAGELVVFPVVAPAPALSLCSST